MAATVRLQRSASPRELLPRLVTEAHRFPGSAWRVFRQALHAWAKALWNDKMGAEAAFPSFDELEQGEQEMATILQARWDRYDADVRAEGVAQGREMGLAQGREMGLAQGREMGLADERTRLRRQATLKFGSGTASLLADRLASLTTFDDLDRVGDWIIECQSGDDLLSRACSIASA